MGDDDAMTQRPIKFRAWDGEHMHLWGFLDEGWYGPPHASGAKYQSYKEMPLMQFTGLLDKNGKEAYEGDKVSALGYSEWIIIWQDNGWKLKQDDVENYTAIPEGFVVFGNIHESN